MDRFELFTVSIAKVSRYIHKIKNEEVMKFNLKSSHVSCLYYLYKIKELTAKELCDMCGEDKANISRTIKFLENEGYIYCSSDLQKRYQSDFSLTEKGNIVGKHIAEKIDKILLEASKGLTDENRKIFYQSLSLICNNLEKICLNYKN